MEFFVIDLLMLNYKDGYKLRIRIRLQGTHCNALVAT